MDLRSRAGPSRAGDPDGPNWAWRFDDGAGGASGDGKLPQDGDWAETSGFSSNSTPPRWSHASGASGTSAASDASWVTEETMGGAQTPLGRDGRRPHESTRAGDEQAKYRRRFKPRTCRICFETVLPTFDFARFAPDGPDFDGVHDPHDNFGEDNANLVGIGAAVGAVGEAAAGLRDRVRGAVASALPPLFQRSRMPRVRYVSENPADGRLISPCHCKGSQKYVHEGCLQAWRHAQPLAERNYWKCPTCGFEYRMQRLRWGRIVSNKAVRGLLTLLVFLATLFVLGFIADPLMDLWTDPVGMLVDTFVGLDDLDLDDATKRRLHDVLGNTQASGAAVADAAASTWWGHLFKGFLSLGIVGVVKTFLVVSPFTWWNLRGTGFGRARRRAGGGRAQFESTGWIFIIVGAFTFLGVAWKFISYLTGRLLERATDHIVDIGGDDPDDDDDEETRE